MTDNEALIEQIQKHPDNETDLIYQLYENNLPLIKKIAMPYSEYEPLEDLLQQSYFGLLEAVKRFEPDKGYKFMTYAGTWIKQGIQRYIEESGRTIRLPAHFIQKLGQYKKYFAMYFQEHCKAPTTKEAAEALGIPESTIEEIKLHLQPLKSLDEEIETEADSVSLSDIIASPEELEAETIDRLYTEYQQITLWDICEQFTTEREEEVLKARFQDNKSYRQISDDMQVSFERVRQIEQKTLRKLGMGKARKELQNRLYIEDNLKYGSGLESYKEHDFTSSVERRILNRERIREELEKKYGFKIPC